MPGRLPTCLPRSTGAVALFFVLLLVACTPEQPIRVASHVWLGYEPMFLAQSMGWLDETRVSFHETASASDSMSALAAGRVEAAALTLDEVLQLREDGLDLTVVLVFNVSAGADMIMARPKIDSVADLAGRRVGFEHDTVGELLIVEALRQAGLDQDQINPLDLSVDEHLEAYLQGEVDALATYEPVASLLGQRGAVRIFDSSQMPEYIVDVLAVRRDLIASRGESLAHLVAQHLRAVEYFQVNPQDAAFRMAPRLELPASEVVATYRGLVLPDLAGNYRLLYGESPDLLTAAQGLLEFQVEQGLLGQQNDLDQLLSARFLPPLEF